jgi:hypothetical protein
VTQGLQLFRHFTKDNNGKARVLFGKALELDPHYAMGFVWLAWTYWSAARFHWRSPKLHPVALVRTEAA